MWWSEVMPSPHRRVVLRAGAALAWAATLAGCGFALRRPPELRFRTIRLTGFAPRSPLAEELRSRIDASSTTRVVESGGQAEVVLQALVDARERSVVSSTAAGQVRELQLVQRLIFSLRTPAGRELAAPTEIVLSRVMSYAESAALAKEQEEAQLFRAMQTDIAAQVLRRLAALPAL